MDIQELQSKVSELSDSLKSTLGYKLKVAHLDELVEQDLNARAQTKEMFNQLVTNVAKEQRLESTPLVAEVDGKLEIVSGHHRIRAARKAGLSHILVIVEDDLTRDQIKAKQLSHNSINGVDDNELVKRIYDQIEAIDAKVDAFVFPDDFKQEVQSFKLEGIDLDMLKNVRAVQILFLDRNYERFQKALDVIQLNGDQILIGDIEDFNKWGEAVKRVSGVENVRAVPAILSIMADRILELYPPLPEPEDPKDTQDTTPKAENPT